MKAISLHQPWASLLVTRRPYPDCGGCGAYQHDVSYHDDDLPMVKTIETRSWSCPPKIIGQRIAFHAAKRKPKVGWDFPYGAISHSTPDGACWQPPGRGGTAGPRPVTLPLGAIVGSGVIAACVPIRPCSDDVEHVCVGGGYLTHHRPLDGDEPTEIDISDQLPYGNYSMSYAWRFAWLIEDAAPTMERCPWCADWRGLIEQCPVCFGTGHCDPIPAKGHQRIWEWNSR